MRRRDKIYIVRALFYKAVYEKENSALREISENVSFFVKKFDYRSEGEPWDGRQNAPEAAIDFICGDGKL